MPDQIVVALFLALAFALITAVGRLARAHPEAGRRRSVDQESLE
jgi:hypothetical protein